MSNSFATMPDFYQRKLVSILEAHSVTWQMNGSELEAFDVITGPNGEDASHWTKVDGWSVDKLYRWLGY